eukprot:766328-Hanusia_phi.AAC.5
MKEMLSLSQVRAVRWSTLERGPLRLLASLLTAVEGLESLGRGQPVAELQGQARTSWRPQEEVGVVEAVDLLLTGLKAAGEGAGVRDAAGAGYRADLQVEVESFEGCRA